MKINETADDGFLPNEIETNRENNNGVIAETHRTQNRFDEFEEFVDEVFAAPKKAAGGFTPDGLKREFLELNRTNSLDCNLTELGASVRIDEGYMSHTDWIGHASRYGYAMKQLEHGELKNARTVLDVGCGTLQMPHFFYKNRFNPGPKVNYFGLDLRATQNWLPKGCFWKANISLVRTDVLVDDLTRVPSWPGQFDAVVCFEMLEHVPRAYAPKLIEKLFTWTKPGGVCLLSTPNAGVSRSVSDNHVGADGVREWTFDDKLAMARTAGFKVKGAYGILRDKQVPQSEAGCWIRINPLDGEGIGNKNVTVFRYALLEMDSVPLDLQLAFFARIELPIAAIVKSGGKSVHAWVKVDCLDATSYTDTVGRLYALLAVFGIDQSNKNPSRLARFPGATRQIGRVGDGAQELLYLNPNPTGQAIIPVQKGGE